MFTDRDIADFVDKVDPARLPRLAAVGDRWSAVSAQNTYPRALEAFVDGLLAQAAS
jgi:hypothetical protein